MPRPLGFPKNPKGLGAPQDASLPMGMLGSALALCYTWPMSLLSPLHPRFVHFPIALLLAGSVAALIYLLGRQRPALATFAWISLGLGWLALFPVVLTGLIDQNQASRAAAVVAVLNPHIAAGFVLIAIYGIVLLERVRSPLALDNPKRRTLLIVLLVAGIALIALEGWLGGKLVYDLGVGVQSP